MALTSGSILRTNTNTIKTDLSHINILVNEASITGADYIVVEPTIIDDTMIELIRSYGYKVYPISDSMGTHTRYKISW